ncbi:MAG: HNH endonuclease [Candidatus Acidiferrales bacterium]
MRYRKLKINGRTVYEHRWLMEQCLGRALTWREVVHHRNGSRTDNRPENLEVVDRLDHSRHHMLKNPVAKQCVVCGSEFAPPASHRPRDRTCSEKCKRALIALRRLGARARTLDFVAINRAVAAGESLRSVGRRVGLSHRSVKRIGAWPPPLAEAVARSVAEQLQVTGERRTG